MGVDKISNTKKLKEAVKNTAKNLADTAESVKKATENKFSKNKNYQNSKAFKEHKHCKICGKVISPSVEELLCKTQDCIERNEKETKVKKQLRLWMAILVAALLIPNVLPLFGINII